MGVKSSDPLAPKLKLVPVSGASSHGLTEANFILKVLSHALDGLLNVLFLTLIFAFRFRLGHIPDLLPFIIALPVSSFLYLYLTHRFFGQSLGQWLTGLARVSRKTGERVKRVYDWIFETELKTLVPLAAKPAALRVVALGFAIFIFSLGLVYSKLGQNRMLRSLKIETLPVFAPEAGNADWKIIPLYYATGAWPVSQNGEPILYTLPYERGPPERFLGKVIAYAGKKELKFTWSGPLTLKSSSSRDELRECLQVAVHCFSARQEIVERYLRPLLGDIEPKSVRWFEVDNPNMDADEAPEGIWFQAMRRSTQIEGYLMINEKMAAQSILFESDDPTDTELGHTILREIVGSQRLSTDLLASRTWINQALSQFKARKDDLSSLIQSQALLLSKLSVEPTSFDAIYHLAGTAYYLFEWATKNNRPTLAHSAQTTLESAALYAADVNPNDPRISEIEQLEASAERR